MDKAYLGKVNMIDMERQIIILHGCEFPITKWDIWFQSPVGLFEEANEAITRIKALDLPCLTLRPVPVARNMEHGVYEPVF